MTWAHFLSLAQSKLRLCSANHKPGYWSNLPCDWPSTAWAYSEQETENMSWYLLNSCRSTCTLYPSCGVSVAHWALMGATWAALNWAALMVVLQFWQRRFRLGMFLSPQLGRLKMRTMLPNCNLVINTICELTICFQTATWSSTLSVNSPFEQRLWSLVTSSVISVNHGCKCSLYRTFMPYCSRLWRRDSPLTLECTWDWQRVFQEKQPLWLCYSWQCYWWKYAIYIEGPGYYQRQPWPHPSSALASVWHNVSSGCNHDLTVWYGLDGEPLLKSLSARWLLVKEYNKSISGNGMAWFWYEQTMPNKLRQLNSLSFKVSLRSCINQIMKTTLLWLVHGTHLCFTRVNFAQGKCQLSPQKMQANLWQISLCCHRTRHGLLWFDVQFHRLIMFQVHHEEILQRYDNHKFREILHVLNSKSSGSPLFLKGCQDICRHTPELLIFISLPNSSWRRAVKLDALYRPVKNIGIEVVYKC